MKKDTENLLTFWVGGGDVRVASCGACGYPPPPTGISSIPNNEIGIINFYHRKELFHLVYNPNIVQLIIWVHDVTYNGTFLIEYPPWPSKYWTGWIVFQLLFMTY